MASSLQLVDPRLDLVESYRELVHEFEAAGEDLVPFPLRFPHEDGPALIERLRAASRGEGLSPGFVANSTLWLVQDDTTVVGVSNLRHELTPFLRHEGGHIGYGVRPGARGRGFGREILRLTLGRAAALGIDRVLVVCDADNESSVRVILANGGELEADDVVAEDGSLMHRYWISVDEERSG